MMTQAFKRESASLAKIFDAEVHRALSDPNRVAILSWLAVQKDPKMVSEIAESGCCRLDLSMISRHLSVMRDAGLLERARRGRIVLYRVRADSLVGTLRDQADALEKACRTRAFGAAESPDKGRRRKS